MTTQLFSSSFKPSWKQVVVSFLVVVYIVINIFRIGGDSFVFSLNNTIPTLLALCVTLVALMLWRQVAIGSHNRLLWSELALGWTFWTIAEFWWGIAAAIGQEVPYPSWADFFWVIGYIPMFIALWNRILSLPENVNLWQKAGIWFSILLSVGWTIFFVLIPTVRNNDPTAILESFLNIIYPLVDLVLLILVLQLFFTYQQGMYGRAWAWLSSGFILRSLADLIFAYANTTNQYYPDARVNLISTIGVDVPYTLAYLLWLIGLFMMQAMQRSHRTFTENDARLALVPNTHLLVFAKGDDSIIDVSRNYLPMFSLERAKGKTISEVLGISSDDANSLLRDVKAKKILKEKTILIQTSSGQQQAWVSGISVADPQGQYSGTTLLLRILSDDYTLDELLTVYQESMVQSVLSKTGAKEKEDEEIKQLLSNYYLAYFKAFYNRIFAEGGSILADAFITELQSVANYDVWQVGIRPDNLLDVSALPLSKTQEALPILLETAEQFVAKIIDQATANTITQNVRSQFEDITLRNVSHFEIARDVRT